MPPQTAPSPCDVVKSTAQQPVEHAQLCRELRFQKGFLFTGVFPPLLCCCTCRTAWLPCLGSFHSFALAGLGSQTGKLSAGFKSLGSQPVPTLQRLILTPDNKIADFPTRTLSITAPAAMLHPQFCFCFWTSPDSEITTSSTAPTRTTQRVFLDNYFPIRTRLFSFSPAFHSLWDRGGGRGGSPLHNRQQGAGNR